MFSSAAPVGECSAECNGGFVSCSLISTNAPSWAKSVYFLPIAWAYLHPVNEHCNRNAKTLCEEQGSNPSMVACVQTRRVAFELVPRA